MKTVNHNELKEVLYTAYATKTSCFIWGTMGIGKSETIKTVAEDIGNFNKLKFVEGEGDEKSFGFIDVRISQLEPSDLRGLPSFEGGKTKWLPPNWLPSNSKSHGILFLDEINLAPPSIQAAAYQLILDRKIGEYKLPDGWNIVAAGNTTDDRANIYDLSAPLSNRFIHITLRVPTKEEWSKWALNKGLDGAIVSFLEFKPQFLYKFDSKMKDKAFPTPRSWFFVDRLLKSKVNQSEEMNEILIASAVGEGVAIEYVAFLKLKKQIKIDQILKNPQEAGKLKELDLKYSLIGGLVEKYRGDKKTLEPITCVCEYLEPEFAILLLRMMKDTRMDFVECLVKCPKWKVLSQRYSKYIYDFDSEE